MSRLFPIWLLLACLLLPAPAGRAGEAEDDETALKEAKLETDPAALVEFFRRRVLPENDLNKVTSIIRKLGDEEFTVRYKASADLVAMGPGVLKSLRENVNNTDPEVAARVKDALEVVERTSTPPLLSAAARLLGHKKHPEGAEVLLEFAPVAESEEVLDAIRQALDGLAVRDGKPEPALTQALAGKNPLRRSLAAGALIRTEQLKGDDARKLLTDEDAFVRLRAALALVRREDKKAIETLIDVLPAVPLQQAWQAEDILYRLAGDAAPNVSLGDDEASRRTARTAWEKWWKENEATVRLKALEEAPPFLGFTVVAFQDPNTGQGKIQETDRADKTRWEFTGITFPVTDIQMLPNERVLLSELNGARVTERDKKGKIVWSKNITQPVSAQRLVNGNTVISTRSGIFEYNAAGKEVFTYNRGRSEIMSARKHRNGEYILLTLTAVVRINAQGKEVGTWPIGRSYSYSSFDILPNGNVLIPLTRNNQIVEYKLDGSTAWSANVPFPTSVQRLPNGNTFVASLSHRTLTEIDRTGKEVSKTTMQGQPYVAIRR